MTIFKQFVGIDYSGAKTPTSSLKSLRVYSASVDTDPVDVFPPPSPRKYWTRKGIAHWLVDILSSSSSTVVGIDHAFSFPLPYFEEHGPEHDWAAFLEDFQLHWPADQDKTTVDFVRDGLVGDGVARIGDTRWRRLTESQTGSAKSVFHFDVQGQVAKSTHAGLPWLRFLRNELGPEIHFWPFDGW